MKRKSLFITLGLTFSALSLSACVGIAPASSSIEPKNYEVKTSLVEGKTDSSTAEMIKDVKPSVVDVYSNLANGTSCGSGVIVGKSDSNDYFIITNHHVVDNAKSFSVTLYDKNDNSKNLSANLIGTSPTNDIAVLSVHSEEELSVASFGESDKAQVGEDVVAIGNPLGILGGTVTKGIVSSLEREVYLSELNAYMKLIQTDAAINNGNSGGALFNSSGLLIGVVNSGYSSYEGLNFAIPSNNAKSCFTSIVNTCKDGHLGYVEGENNMGLTFSSSNLYTDASCKALESYVFAYSVRDANCDAYKNGIADYSRFLNGLCDTFFVIDKINGTQITSDEQATKIIQNLQAGSDVTISYKTVGAVRTNPFDMKFYIKSGELSKTFTLSQYIYSISE